MELPRHEVPKAIAVVRIRISNILSNLELYFSCNLDSLLTNNTFFSAIGANRHNRDIGSIYLRCSAGKITWKYPKGAIRIVLRPTFSTDSGFRVCLKMIKSKDSAAQVQRLVQNSIMSNTRRQYGRIYLSAGKRFISFDTNRNGNKQYVRCFNSMRDEATIYVEADGRLFPMYHIAVG